MKTQIMCKEYYQFKKAGVSVLYPAFVYIATLLRRPVLTVQQCASFFPLMLFTYKHLLGAVGRCLNVLKLFSTA